MTCFTHTSIDAVIIQLFTSLIACRHQTMYPIDRTPSRRLDRNHLPVRHQFHLSNRTISVALVTPILQYFPKLTDYTINTFTGKIGSIKASVN